MAVVVEEKGLPVWALRGNVGREEGGMNARVAGVGRNCQPSPKRSR